MWKSIIGDQPHMLDESQNLNPLYRDELDEWVEAVMQEPWFVALCDLARETGIWTGIEEQLMEGVRLRVGREVWESEAFPSTPQKLEEYYLMVLHSYPGLNLVLLDYNELNKEDLKEFDVPGWGPKAPILLELDWAGRKPSFKWALDRLVVKYRRPLPVAVLWFTRFSGMFTRRKTAWRGSTMVLAEALCLFYPPLSVLDRLVFPRSPSDEDPDGWGLEEAQRAFEESEERLQELYRFMEPSDLRWFHGSMKTCAYIVKEVGIEVSWKKEPRTVKDSEGNSKKIERTIWTIEAPYWSR